jgi:hypothetical protein
MMRPMQLRVRSARRAGTVAALATVALCGCADGRKPSSRPAPTARIATDWAGEHVPPTERGAAPLVVPRDAWVLHVGDSFVEAHFNQNLWPKFRAAGVRYVVRGTTATYTTTWAHDPEFDALLAGRPALVIVTLGANEFDIGTPEEHARAVESIAHKIARAGAACVWTSPPMWTKDTGIVTVIHDHCAPCVFFDSDAALGGGLTPAERQPDRIHPNPRGGARWAAVFWSWLLAHREVDAGPWVLVPYEHRGT